MKRVLYLIRQGPGVGADETTDLALVSGVFEQRATMLFMDDGVFQLLGLRQRQSSLKALPTYDIDDIRACERSLTERGVALPEIDLPVRPASHDDIRELLANVDIVIPD